MTDIVERLRLLVPSDSSGAAFDAVNEITRLRNELHIAQVWSERLIAGREQDMTEITALRAEVASKDRQFQEYARKMEADMNALAAQNERLRAENETILSANRDVMLHWDALKADYERLRAALAWFADEYDRMNFMRSADMHRAECRCLRCARDEARAALEEKQ